MNISKIIRSFILFITVCATVILAGLLSVSAISSGHWNIDYADFTLNQGIIEGGTRSSYDPGDTFTRAEMAYALAKIGGGPTSGTATTGFSDVPSTHAYAAPIKWCKDNNIVFGNSSSTYNPDGLVTREIACLFIYRYCNQRNVPLPDYRSMITFDDHSDISSGEIYTAVSELYKVEMINGFNDNTFRPKTNIEKSAVAVMLTNLDAREYNNDHTIVVYVKYSNGQPFTNAAVYVTPTTSSSNVAYVPVRTLSAAPGKGIARYENLDPNQTYGINVFTNAVSASVEGLKSPERKYVFVTVPANQADTTGVPFDGYTKSHWPHETGECNELTWVFNSGFCPTTLCKRNQNFGWRFGISRREFHQGLDFSCSYVPVKSIAPDDAEVVRINDNPNTSTGKYVQLRCDDVFFTYQHLSEIYVAVGDTVSSGEIFGKSGNTGIGTRPHLHITVATINDIAPNLYADSDPIRNSYLDPRVYIN